jgi:iron complex transport system permease protein
MMALAAPWILGLITILVILLSLCIGVYSVPFTHVGRIIGALAWPFSISGPVVPWTLKEQIVVQVVRLPRVIIATMAGLGLGLSGAALQGMMRNPLVSPDLVGVTSGAAFGGVLAMLFDFSGFGIVGFALAGGMMALACTSKLVQLVRRSGDSFVVILAGVFIGAFFTALVGITEYVSDSHTQLPSMVYWMLGSFVSADPKKVAMIIIPTLGAGSVLMLLRWRINLLSLGDLDATSLGFNATRLRWIIILLVSLIVASQVAACGVIAWVGLVVPHLARLIVGPDHRRLLPVSALLGGLFTLVLDDISRIVFSQEIPVGLLTAVVGTPVICYLFWKTQSKGWSNE